MTRGARRQGRGRGRGRSYRWRDGRLIELRKRGEVVHDRTAVVLVVVREGGGERQLRCRQTGEAGRGDGRGRVAAGKHQRGRGSAAGRVMQKARERGGRRQHGRSDEGGRGETIGRIE